jgi:NADH-quinone oxidoreductase subunit J
VHSVLWLILAFFNAAGLFVLLGAEFLAMLLVIVYVGAVAVLFLFVVMMLDIDFAELRAASSAICRFGMLVGARAAGRAGAGAGRVEGWGPGTPGAPRRTPPMQRCHQHRGARRMLYTRLYLPLPGGGHDLLVAMIGAIVLTLRHARRGEA